MEREYSDYNPITEGKIGTQMLIFFFPILFGSLFQQIYNAADTLIVGRYLGKIALSAVGASSGQVIMMVVGFFVGIASGAAVLVSQYYGAGDDENVSKAVHTVMAFSILCGGIIMIAGILLAEKMMIWMHAPKETIELSVIYLRVYFAGMIANLIYNVGSGVLRAVGDSKRPFYFLVICCFLNIILDLLFIIVLHMGVFGAALATILSQSVSAVLVIIIMMRQDDSYKLVLSKLRLEPSILKSMVKVGLPAGFQSIMYGISNLVIQVAVNTLGTDYVAAWATYYKIDGIFWMTVVAYGVTVATFVGQNLGAGKIDRVKKSIVVCFMQAATASILISVFVYVASPWIFPLFTKDVAVKAIGVSMMRYLTRFYITYISIEILSGALRGAGDTFIPMLISSIGVCLVRLIWIMLMLPIHPDMYTMMNCYPISWTLSSIAFWIYLLKFSKLSQKLPS